ncbi:MAG TPA: cell division protein FtsL [Candidatus Rifleibacterium sp.]|nr:cell division protein FtsL [Candidatus Rifleibacterium sp.]HPT46983.1 cell division protein FtsL [Candidatus Rifleibacterium sp.]
MNNAKILLAPGPTEPITRTQDRDDTSPETTSRRRQIIRLYLTAILLLSAMLTVYIWQSTKMVEVKLRIKNVEKDISNIENANADLRAEISKLQSLARIETVAKTELGMIIPRRLIYITMPENWNRKNE